MTKEMTQPVIRLYTDDEGETHFEDIEIPLKGEGPFGFLSAPEKVTDIVFRYATGDYNYDWHTAPRRQYIIMLDAGVEIVVSNGETRVIEAGEVLLVEDTTGRGHISRAFKKQPQRFVFIGLE